MSIEYSLHTLSRLKSRDRGIACTLGAALTGFWPTKENYCFAACEDALADP